MNAIEVALTIFFPVLGACGAWIVASRTREYLADRQQRFLSRAGNRPIDASVGEIAPENPRLAAEIERLR